MRRFTTLVAMVIAMSAILAACGASSSNDLIGKDWQLVAMTDKLPAFQGVVPPADQAKYVITFNEGLTFNSTVDCNRLAGTYKTPGRDGMEITPGPMTMAFCGEGSLDILFVHALGKAATYRVVDNRLTITLSDEGTLTFVVGPPETASPEASGAITPAPSATAEATAKPTATPTAKPTPTPTAKPTAKPTASQGATPGPTAKPTAKPTATPVATSAPSPGTGLIGKVWQLTAITEKNPPFQGVVPADQQANYTIEFLADGTFSAKADCNTVTGAYVTADATTASGDLTLVPGLSTLVACADGSYGDLYVIGLTTAAGYAIANNQLTITLVREGTLVYK